MPLSNQKKEEVFKILERNYGHIEVNAEKELIQFIDHLIEEKCKEIEKLRESWKKITTERAKEVMYKVLPRKTVDDEMYIQQRMESAVAEALQDVIKILKE